MSEYTYSHFVNGSLAKFPQEVLTYLKYALVVDYNIDPEVLPRSIDNKFLSENL